MVYLGSQELIKKIKPNWKDSNEPELVIRTKDSGIELLKRVL